MPSRPRPAPEFETTVGLVRRLLTAQHRDLAALPVRWVASGWDNSVFRLGDAYAVRLPRRRVAAALMEHELRWLPELAPALPLPVSVPLRSGRPGCGYPWPWAITPWFEGTTAEQVSLADQRASARALGRFVAATGRPAPADAPTNRFRGVPLADRHTRVLQAIEVGVPEHQRTQARRVWSAALDAPAWSGRPVWLHGDLHPANLLVRGGDITAVIDFGDLTSGDPATDLSVAWMLFHAADRAIFREAAGGCDDNTWVRARGNALAHAVACLCASSDDPVIASIGFSTLALVLADT
ncbi:MAG: aminoglycoside phosphotransferase family protein [Ornithinimicrobium sp.]